VDGVTSNVTYRSTIYIQSLRPACTGSVCVPSICAFIGDFDVQFTNADGSQTNSFFFHNFLVYGGGWVIATTQGTQPLRSGYATLDCGSTEVTAQVAYSLYVPDGQAGTKLAEATVFSSPPGRSVQLLNDGADGARLGVAIANDTSTDTSVQIRVGNLSGQILATRTLPVSANSSVVGFLDELVPGLPVRHKGQVFFDSAQQINVIGLRFTNSVYTTIPSTVREP
jgi:hypothetical protein